MSAIPRCCRDSLAQELQRLNGPLVEGLEVPCKEWCNYYWRWNGTEWLRYHETKGRIDRMSAQLDSPDYWKERARVLGKPPIVVERRVPKTLTPNPDGGWPVQSISYEEFRKKFTED